MPLMMPAVESTLSVADMCTLLADTQFNHAQYDPAVISKFIDFLVDVKEAVAANYNSEWVTHMENAVSVLQLLQHSLASSSEPSAFTRAVSATIACSLLVKRAETSDVFRRQSEAIMHARECPFVITEHQKRLVAIAMSAFNMFWVAFDQIRAVHGEQGNFTMNLQSAMFRVAETNLPIAIWIYIMIASNTNDRRRTVVLPNQVIIQDTSLLPRISDRTYITTFDDIRAYLENR